MDITELFDSEHAPLTRRLERMVSSAETAEDLRQEAFARAFAAMPREVSPQAQKAWLYRTASNLAVDHLRRRRLREQAPVEAAELLLQTRDEDESGAARDALALMSAHERLLLLLRFEAGLSHRELAELLAISEEAARKRVARARRAFIGAYRRARKEASPLVLIVGSDAELPAYSRWIERAGARTRKLRPEGFERQLALADALVISGSNTDIDPVLYGEERSPVIGEVDGRRDRRELAVLKSALEQDLPIVGVCRGHQLLNIALGGSLHQDLERDGYGSLGHRDHSHEIATESGTVARRLIGAGAEVSSEHHQAVRRLGRGLRVSSYSPDGLIEGTELAGRGFALGLQWHPEHTQSAAAGDRIAAALIDVAGRRAA